MTIIYSLASYAIQFLTFKTPLAPETDNCASKALLHEKDPGDKSKRESYSYQYGCHSQDLDTIPSP